MSPDEYRLAANGRRGGEGVVWQASGFGPDHEPVEFALKQLLHPAGSDPATWPGAELQARWEQQVKLLRPLSHDHLVGLTTGSSKAGPRTLRERAREGLRRRCAAGIWS